MNMLHSAETAACFSRPYTGFLEPSQRPCGHGVELLAGHEHNRRRHRAAGAYTPPLFQLNVSTFCGIRWVYVGCTLGVLRGFSDKDGSG